MSEASGETTTESDVLEKRKKYQLEEKSKDDLIKIVKKQLSLLQKAKAKNDELNNKCLSLDKEIKKHVETEIVLHGEIVCFENEIASIRLKHENSLKEKDEDMFKLKECLKIFEIDKLSLSSLLNEKQEQIECLSMQLKTVKDTCQYIQEELTQYQQTNKEMKKEVEVLSTARDTVLKSLKDQNLAFDNKLKDYTVVMDEFKELKDKYNICIEENYSLNLKVEELEQHIEKMEYNKLLVENTEANENVSKLAERKKSTDNKSHPSIPSEEIIFLIADNERLVSMLNKLKDENDVLNKNILSLENDQKNIHADESKENYQTAHQDKQLLKAQNEIVDLQNHLYNIENAFSKLRSEKESLEMENQTILVKVKQLSKDKLDVQLKLQIFSDEKLKLESEIKKLSLYFQEFCNFKMGYEHALLHGAETETLGDYPSLKTFQLEEAEFTCSKLDEVSPNISFSKESDYSNVEFEYGLLSGGYVPDIFGNNEVHENKTESNSSTNQCYRTQDNDIVNQECLYLAEEIKTVSSMQDEILHLARRLKSYTNLLKETLEENEYLKQNLKLFVKENEVTQPTSYNEVYTNTEIQFVENSIYEISLAKADEKEICLSNLKEEISSLLKQIAELESKVSSSRKEHDYLTNEVNALKLNLECSEKEIGKLKNLNINLESRLCELEKESFETRQKFEKKRKELDSSNSIVVLLISYITQVVESKIDAAFITSNDLCHNLNNLKLLVEEIISISTTNYITIKDLESSLEILKNQKQECEEKLSHVEELNKFLEEEIKALQDELELLKSAPNFFDSFYNTKCLTGSSELYSIEETNEIEEKIAQVDDSFEGNISFETPEVDTNIKTYLQSKITENRNMQQAQHKDISLQVDLFSLSDSILTEEENDINSKVRAKSEENDSEILYLKNLLSDKCEQTELIINVLNQKEKDLLNFKSIISELEKKIQELMFVNDSSKTALKCIKNLANELKKEKCKLQSDIKLLLTFSKIELDTFIQDCNVTSKQIFENAEFVNKKCTYLEEAIEGFRLYFNNMNDDCNIWAIFLEQVHKDISFDNQLILLEKTFQNPYSSFFSSSDDQFSTSCGMVFKNIKSFDSNKQKLISMLCSYLNTIDKSLSNAKLHESDNRRGNKEESNIVLKQEHGNSDESCIKRQLTDTETKLQKLKQISLKLKKELCDSKKLCNEISLEKQKCAKELDEVRKELETSSSIQLQYVQNYQSLQSEYDKAQDKLELQKENFKKLQEDFASTLFELKVLREKISDTESKLANSKEILNTINIAKQGAEKNCNDLESQLIIEKSKSQEKVIKIRELESTIEANQDSIKITMNENNNLRDQLSRALKEETKNNLLDLEMADYERSVSELNTRLQTKENEIIDLKKIIKSEVEKNQCLQEEIKSTDTLKETEEKRATNLKEALENIKTELLTAKGKEGNLLATVQSLHLQLEIIVQQEEDCKLQLSESVAEIQNLKGIIKTSSENHQRIIRSLESKCYSQKQEILCSHKEVETVKQEFDNYKIRVHSVLRQQKSSTSSIAPVELALKEKLVMMVDKLKIQVKDLSEKLTTVSLEHEGLQEEHDTLLQRYNKIIEERAKNDSEWHTRLEKVNAEKNQLRISQEETSLQHLLQNEILVSTYKKQIKIMNEEYKRSMNELQKQLEIADFEISRLQKDQLRISGVPVASSSNDSSPPFDILSQERQEGEGSECIDGTETQIQPMLLSTIPASGSLSFEKLIQSPIETESSTNFLQCQECEKLFADLNAANKKIDHLSEVLNESESTNLRMSEQVRVLKEEVKRLIRNKEREEHAENLEYLKNVFIKFATLNACAEKAMLIPVLTTMLKLSPPEQQQLKDVAGDGDPNDTTNSGWGSYLHRWSGLA